MALQHRLLTSWLAQGDTIVFKKIIEVISFFVWIRDMALIARSGRLEDVKRFVLAA